MFKKIVLAIILLAGSASMAYAALPYAHREDAEKADSLIKIASADRSASLGDRMAMIAESFVGSGKDDYYYKDTVATLRVNLQEFTPMTFINTVEALARTAGDGNPGIVQFEDNLRKVSCRRGEDAGFASLMWHASDWIGDNLYRGNITELTERYGDQRDRTKSLDYLTRNRDKYAALANAETYDKVRMTEMGFRSHKIPYLPKQFIGKKSFEEDARPGDIIIMVPNEDGQDIFQIGILTLEKGDPYLIHFDVKKGMVVKESEPLKRYFNLVSKYFGGFRWLRIKE